MKQIVYPSSACLLFCLVTSIATGESGVADVPSPIHPRIELRNEVRHHPRLIRIYTLLIPAKDPDLCWDVAVGPDNDGPGPSEASLMDPLRLAAQAGLIVGTNANAWATALADENRSGNVAADSCPGSQVVINICGWVCRRGQTVSPPDPAHWSFWLSTEGEPRVGRIVEEVPAAIAVSGFGPLVINGLVLRGNGGELAPRTAVGITADRQKVILMVVDGRRRGWSEGVTTGELAALMAEAGAWDAIQLDGGGTTTAFLCDREGKYRLINRPSDLSGARPMPVVFGVRLRQKSSPNAD